jgi:large subunit ribosomal protein L24
MLDCRATQPAVCIRRDRRRKEREMAVKIRRDDLVEVMSGKDAGKRGKVLRVDPGKSRVYIEGLNVVKRHQRPRSIKDTQRGGRVGGVIEKEGPIHISNVMLVDPKEDRPTRLGVERGPDRKRVRIAKRSNTRLE